MKTVEELQKEWGGLKGGSVEQYIYDYFVNEHVHPLKEALKELTYTDSAGEIRTAIYGDELVPDFVAKTVKTHLKENP
jgi:hypothetical protein